MVIQAFRLLTSFNARSIGSPTEPSSCRLAVCKQEKSAGEQLSFFQFTSAIVRRNELPLLGVEIVAHCLLSPIIALAPEEVEKDDGVVIQSGLRKRVTEGGLPVGIEGHALGGNVLEGVHPEQTGQG